MRTATSLTDLHDTLAGQNVLSVYLATDNRDPALRDSWRLRLNSLLDALAQSVAAAEAEGFTAARTELETRLRSYDGFLPGRGWAAFATAKGVRIAEDVSVPLPDRARWQRGPVLGPWLRTQQQRRPVTIALVDSRRARLFRYVGGQLEERIDHRADTFIDDLTDRNVSKRAATGTGVRGETATDAAAHILRQETERLLARVVDDLRAAGAGQPLIIGGPQAATARLRSLLSSLPGPVREVPALHLAMTSAEILDAVEPELSMLTDTLQLETVQELIEQAEGGDRALLGGVGSADAAAAGQVEELLLTPHFIETNEVDAEVLIAAVLDRGGTVDLVDGAAGTLLDARGAGAAVRLRYVQTPAALTTSSARR